MMMFLNNHYFFQYVKIFSFFTKIFDLDAALFHATEGWSRSHKNLVSNLCCIYFQFQLLLPLSNIGLLMKPCFPKTRLRPARTVMVFIRSGKYGILSPLSIVSVE